MGKLILVMMLVLMAWGLLSPNDREQLHVGTESAMGNSEEEFLMAAELKEFENAATEKVEIPKHHEAQNRAVASIEPLQKKKVKKQSSLDLDAIDAELSVLGTNKQKARKSRLALSDKQYLNKLEDTYRAAGHGDEKKKAP